MRQYQKLFENIFDNKNITADRLSNFAKDCISRFTAQNADGSLTTILDSITPAYNALRTELGHVDTNMTIQMGKTKTVEQITAGFKKIMKEKNGVIADALGGFDEPVYLEFYPHGLMEYTRATHAELPALLKRINTAATTHAAQLPAALATKLQNFEADWNNIHTEQQQLKGMVSDKITDKNAARPPLELALHAAVHSLAKMYPGNVQQCMAFFDFSLLEVLVHHKREESTPPVAAAVIPAVQHN